MDCKEAEKLIQPYVQGNMPEERDGTVYFPYPEMSIHATRNWRHIYCEPCDGIF